MCYRNMGNADERLSYMVASLYPNTIYREGPPKILILDLQA